MREEQTKNLNLVLARGIKKSKRRATYCTVESNTTIFSQKNTKLNKNKSNRKNQVKPS